MVITNPSRGTSRWPTYLDVGEPSGTCSSSLAGVGSSRDASISSLSVSTVAKVPKRTIKVVLIGDAGSGKTSIRNHFLTGSYSPSYRATIGADFITKTLPIDASDPQGAKAVLQIWDTAGQERFQSLGSAFYRGADAVILAMDLSKVDPADPESLSSLSTLPKWFSSFMDKAPGPNAEDSKRFCWICAANKADIIETYGLPSVERSRIREVLDELVPSPPSQPDWGIDRGQTGHRPSGAKEPASPAEVLSRPDPTTTAGKETPFQTPFNTITAPRAASKSSWSLSNFAPTKSASNTTRGSERRQVDYKRLSIRSIELFHPPSDDEEDEEDSPAAAPVFPKTRTSLSATDRTPPRKTLSTSVGHDRRKRVDSSMSMNAPSVYHTPRTSTLLSTSPSRLSADVPSSPTPLGSRSLRPSSTTSTTRDAGPLTTLKAPTSFPDVFAPEPEASISSAASTARPPHPAATQPAIISPTASLDVAPPATTAPASIPDDVEQGFTLFYTSARTGHNLERMFQHIVHRVVASDAHAAALLEPLAVSAARFQAEQEQIRRTIRIASGKNPDKRWGCC